MGARGVARTVRSAPRGGGACDAPSIRFRPHRLVQSPALPPAPRRASCWLLHNSRGGRWVRMQVRTFVCNGGRPAVHCDNVCAVPEGFVTVMTRCWAQECAPECAGSTDCVKQLHGWRRRRSVEITMTFSLTTAGPMHGPFAFPGRPRERPPFSEVQVMLQALS